MSRKNNPHDDLQSELRVYKMVNARVRSKQAAMSNYAKSMVEETGRDALLAVVRNYVAELCMKYYEDPATAMAKTTKDFVSGSTLCSFRPDLSSERDPSRGYRPTLVFTIGDYGHEMVIHPARYHSKSSEKILESVYESLSSDISIRDMANISIEFNEFGGCIKFEE